MLALQNRPLENQQLTSPEKWRQKKMLIIAVGPDELLKTKDRFWREKLDPDEYLKTQDLFENAGRGQHVVEKKDTWAANRDCVQLNVRNSLARSTEGGLNAVTGNLSLPVARGPFTRRPARPLASKVGPPPAGILCYPAAFVLATGLCLIAICMEIENA